jgi:hypothetical protein
MPHDHVDDHAVAAGKPEPKKNAFGDSVNLRAR